MSWRRTLSTNKRQLLFLIISMIYISKAFPYSKILVMGIESINLTQSQISSINSKIKIEFSTNNEVISDNLVNRFIQSRRLNKNDLCFNQDLVYELGKYCAAQKTISTFVSKTEDNFVITITVRDIKSGKIRHVTKSCKGDFNLFSLLSLKEAIKEIQNVL